MKAHRKQDDDDKRPETLGEMTREEAAFRSRKCALCGGCGMTAVYHWSWIREEGRIGPHPTNGVQFPRECAAHCLCDHGRWIRRHTESAILNRIPDGVQVARNETCWSFNPPDFNDQENYAGDEGERRRELIERFSRPIGKPASDPFAPRTAAQIAEKLKLRAAAAGDPFPQSNPELPPHRPSERE